MPETTTIVTQRFIGYDGNGDPIYRDVASSTRDVAGPASAEPDFTEKADLSEITGKVLDSQLPAGFGGGTHWFSQEGLPDDAIGADGDYDINDLNADVYQKVDGTWGA